MAQGLYVKQLMKKMINDTINCLNKLGFKLQEPDLDKLLKHTGDLFKLVTISNRGTQVWPKGSIFTNLVNQYRCRFESIEDMPVTQVDILELYKRVMDDFKICSTELLNMWGDKKAYSLAQGQ